MDRSKKPLILNLALVVGSIVISLGMAEGLLRLLKLPQTALTHTPCIYTSDADLGYRFIPNATDRMQKNFEIDSRVETNSLGFHDVEHALETSQTRRILALGDSFTAALEVERSQGWTQTLERQLQQQGYTQVEVINLGIDGSSTDTQLALLKEYLPIFQPELVILAFYRNDPEEVRARRTYRECYKGYTLAYPDEATAAQMRGYVDNARPLNPIFGWLFKHVYLVRLIASVPGQDFFIEHNYQLPFHNYYVPSMLGLSPEKWKPNPPSLDTLFQELMTLAQQHNFRLLVVPVPATSRWYQPTDSMTVLQQSLSEPVFNQLEIADVLPLLTNRLSAEGKQFDDLFWRYDEHFDAAGYRLFGEAVAQAVAQYFNNAPIELHVEPAQAGLWTVVQWQDANSDWHDVEGWQGPLNVGGRIRWWVSAKDYGTGPFRWVVTTPPPGSTLAASELFFLPRANESLHVWLALESQAKTD